MKTKTLKNLNMDTKKEARKYLNKYFKAQHINESDDEFKSLVRLLHKSQQPVKNLNTEETTNSDLDDNVCQKCGNTGRCEPRTSDSPDGQERDCNNENK